MFKAPGQLPPFSLLLDDLPTRCARSIARHLGITSQTLKRYQVEDQAPRLVQLALFWETRWGQSVLDCEIFNRDQVQRSHIGALQREGDQLKAQISRLVELVDSGDYGAANGPLWETSRALGGNSAPPGVAQTHFAPPHKAQGTAYSAHTGQLTRCADARSGTGGCSA